MVLIIEDEELMAEMFGMFLEKGGYRVSYACGGNQGVETFSRNPKGYDLVLLDFLLPDLSGERVFERLRKIEPHAKVLFMSGLNRSEKIDALIRAGAVGFVEKPCRSQELIDHVAKALEHNGAE